MLQIEYNNRALEKVCTDAQEARKNTDRRWQKKFNNESVKFLQRRQLKHWCSSKSDVVML